MGTIKIAIDGPAGAGKSTISKAVAKSLKYIYIDTGAMYRAVGLAVIRADIDTKNIDGIKSVLNGIDIDIRHTDEEQLVLLNGEDVTKEIRTPAVSVAASDVAVVNEVRIKLVELQRKLAEKANVIMDGRDIGTYVLPNANIKIFLTASVEERAKRRYEELILKGTDCVYEDVKNDIEYRDKNDSQREFAPLRPADDSIIINTTGNSLEESIDIILNIILERL